MKPYRPLAAAVVSLIVCISAFAQKIVFQARVIDVVDGSTVIVETQAKTKFEVKCQATTVPKDGEPYADYARQRLSNIVLRQMVTVEYTERNEYGHILGTISLNGEDICLDQIAVGLASFDPQAPNNLKTARRELYAGTEKRARNSGTGIWTTSTAAVANSNVLNNGVTGTTAASGNPSAVSSVSVPNTSNQGTTVDVRGYLRKDGTYVDPHKRTASDATFDNNWTTRGNVNPYTGKPGTKSWLGRNWWIFPTVGALIGTGFLVRRFSGGGIGIPCNDGTISQAQNRQGACSHHGGIR